MLANQITNHRFNSAGKGGYKANEVDGHLQNVAASYEKLQNENNTLKSRLAALTPIIDEYNENKKAIVNALVAAENSASSIIKNAKLEATQMLDEAKAETERLVASKKIEADSIYSETIREKEGELEKVKNELAKIKTEIVVLSEKYVEEINKKAAAIIEDANGKASKIVADAYNDAKIARDNAEASLAESELRLATIKKDILSYKTLTEQLSRGILENLSKIEIDEKENFDLPEESDVEAMQINMEDIPAFLVDFSAEEEIADQIFVDNKSSNIFNPDLVNEANTEMPDVNDYISKIFNAVGTEENSFASFSAAHSDKASATIEGTGLSLEDIVIDMDEVESDSENKE